MQPDEMMWTGFDLAKEGSDHSIDICFEQNKDGELKIVNIKRKQKTPTSNEQS